MSDKRLFDKLAEELTALDLEHKLYAAVLETVTQVLEKFGVSPDGEIEEDLTQASLSGDNLRILKALRRRIALALSDEDCAARDLASNGRRLTEVNQEIYKIEEQKKQDEKSAKTTRGRSKSSTTKGKADGNAAESTSGWDESRI